MPQEFLVMRYNRPMVQRYLELFHRQQEYVHRITDSISVEDGTLNRQLAIDLTIPPDTTEIEQPANQLSLVPLMRGRRGRLFDNLTVLDQSQREIGVLAQRENKLLSSLMLETAFSDAIFDIPTVTEETIDHVWRLGQGVAAIPLCNPRRAKRVFDQLFSDGGPLEEIGITGDTFERLRRIAAFLCERFLTTAEVPAGALEKIRLHYSYDTKYRDEPQYRDDDESPKFTSNVRRALGQSPYSFRIRIPLAFAGQSYHFRMHGPKNSYCARQSVLVEDAASPDGPVTPLREWTPLNRSQYRVTSAAGSRYAHIYIHDLDGSYQFPIFARVIFYEVPPGAIGNSALLSASTTLALLVMALLSQAFVSRESSATPLAALIVALPATVALWLQPTPDRQQLLTSPLSSRVGLIASGAFAYGGALLLLVIAVEAPVVGPLRWILQVCLIGLVVPSALCTFVLFERWSTGLKRWRRLQDDASDD